MGERRLTSFKFLPHTADIQVELTARDAPGLYQAGADAVRELLVADSPVVPGESRTIALAGPDEATRLMSFLRELVYLYDVERFIPVSVTLDAGVGTARLAGERLDPVRHRAERELKGVTHHGYTLERSPDGCRATVIFDV
ncbi:MAG: archease [Gemmatimonadales bacterium]